MDIEEYNKILNARADRHKGDPEHQLQVSCVEWFRMAHPKCLIAAIPNGGKRNLITAVKLKAEGVVAGIPDLMVLEPRGEYHGLFIEMKNGKKGRLSDNQREMIDKLRARGYKVEVARNFTEFKNIVDQYFGK